ncbi:hypothetical protein BT63DRAFT_417608 [Microthyrium microscopicum]|uniref:superoxide dismutase n=1 Tax=Microthyrium microscopicum TaxID=703497 RepID=A0A6A6U0W0_9PEZI|nr:hypothetical protein BT63DRAFT_417608 [Microthyrium microscopicum]
MHFSQLLSVTTLAAGIYIAAAASDASVVKDNPIGAWIIADTSGKDGSNHGMLAEVSASSSSDGEGVEMTINLNGLSSIPLSGGPFTYHIHQYPVPENGSCDATGAHLDPTNRGDSPPCDKTKPETCQVGDLAGKHGACPSLPGCSNTFRDPYLSLTPGNPAYIGDKSFVVHYANKTRIACVNFLPSGKSASSAGYNSTSTAVSSASAPGATSTSTSTIGAGNSATATPTGSVVTASGLASSSLQVPGFAGLLFTILGFTMW